MRADIKVGMAIAIILIGIGVVWFVFYRSPAPPAEKAPGSEDAKVTGKTDDKNVVVTKRPPTQPPVLTSTDHRFRTTTTKPAVTTVTPTIVDIRPTGKTGAWDDVPDRKVKTTSIWGTTGTTGTTGMTGSVTSTVPPLAGTARTYVVKENDSYWTIARDLWGDGSLYPHLQKANPGISPDDLRPRMTIKVPPKPVRVSSASAAVATARRGTTGVDLLTGKRYYIVKKGDRGFWDISKAVYGEGKHYRLIEKANPKLDSRRLRPGQKVWCPDKPVKPARVEITLPRTPVYAGTVYTGTTTTAPATVTTGGTGAPTKTTLPDGRIFD